MKMRKADRLARSHCPIASTLDIVGDKWSLLVIRDILYGNTTFGKLLDSPERIPTNILADRLRRLEGAGLIKSSAYQERPTRYAYTLTDKGKALGDILLALVRWGKRHIPGTRTLKKSTSASLSGDRTHRAATKSRKGRSRR